MSAELDVNLQVELEVDSNANEQRDIINEDTASSIVTASLLEKEEPILEDQTVGQDTTPIPSGEVHLSQLSATESLLGSPEEASLKESVQEASLLGTVDETLLGSNLDSSLDYSQLPLEETTLPSAEVTGLSEVLSSPSPRSPSPDSPSAEAANSPSLIADVETPDETASSSSPLTEAPPLSANVEAVIPNEPDAQIAANSDTNTSSLPLPMPIPTIETPGDSPVETASLILSDTSSMPSSFVLVNHEACAEAEPCAQPEAPTATLQPEPPLLTTSIGDAGESPAVRALDEPAATEKTSDAQPERLPETDLFGNGQIVRRVLRAGGGANTRPQRYERLTLAYWLYALPPAATAAASASAAGGGEAGAPAIENEARELVERCEARSVTLGEGETPLGLELALPLVELGEHCLVRLAANYAQPLQLCHRVEREVPKDWLLEYDLELVRVEPAIDWTRVPIAERIDQANQRRERANALYERNENTAAIHVYNRSLEILETEPHAPSSSSRLSGPASPKSGEASPAVSPPAASASDRQLLLEARLRCHLNLAAAQLRARANDAALRSLELVLTHQPENVKALYRKGRALAEKSNDEGALAALSRAAQLDPSNQPVKLELEKLESRLKGRKQREQDTYRRMFNASPPAVAPPNEKHAKRGASHKSGSMFGGWRRTVLLGGLALLAAVAAVPLYRSFSNVFSPSADSALRGLPLSPQGRSFR